MNLQMKLVFAAVILVIFLFGIIQSLRIDGLKKDLENTKTSLYSCRAENKDMVKTLNELKKKSEKIQLNLGKAQKDNAKLHTETEHKINKIITTPIESDCEKASEWSAFESRKIAQEFNIQ